MGAWWRRRLTKRLPVVPGSRALYLARRPSPPPPRSANPASRLPRLCLSATPVSERPRCCFASRRSAFAEILLRRTDEPKPLNHRGPTLAHARPTCDLSRACGLVETSQPRRLCLASKRMLSACILRAPCCMAECVQGRRARHSRRRSTHSRNCAGKRCQPQPAALGHRWTRAVRVAHLVIFPLCACSGEGL